MTSRPLTAEERAILDLLLSREFPGRAELAVQAESVRTGGSSCSCGRPSFSLIADHSLAPAPVTERMVSDADGPDPAGNVAGVLLFTDGGYLSNWSSRLQLSEWSEPNEFGTRWLQN